MPVAEDDEDDEQDDEHRQQQEADDEDEDERQPFVAQPKESTATTITAIAISSNITYHTPFMVVVCSFFCT